MRMIRTLATAIALVPALGGALAAQCIGESLLDRLDDSQRADLAAAVARTPHAEGLFWRATRGGDSIVLVGTMHIWDWRLDAVAARAMPLLDGVEKALFEMTAAEQAQLQTALRADPSLTVITDGPSLPDLLDAATWQALAAAADEHGIPSFVAARMQPWFLATALAIPVCAMGPMAEGRLGLDFTLMAAADDLGIPTGAIEPWDTFFTIFGGITTEEGLDLLRLSIVAPEMQDAMFVAMLDGYFAGRIAEIWELNRIAIDMTPGLDNGQAFFDRTETLLLDDRNRTWIPVIEAEAATHRSILVAVGAAHLPGERGVLSLLQDSGWTLTRLDP